MIGKDTRLSGYMIEYAMVAGFTSVGVDVLLLGPMPTPAVAMLTHSMRADVGVMISASHNLLRGQWHQAVWSRRLQALRRGRSQDRGDCSTANSPHKLANAADLGRAMRVEGERARYIEFAKRTLDRATLRLEGLRIVVDCANGAAYKVAPEALVGIGRRSHHDRRRARRLQHQSGRAARPRPRRCASKVRELRADVGIALDGDADRVIMVDEHGHVIDGDQFMAVVAESWREHSLLTKPGIVATIMSNLGLERYLASLKLSLERTAVGDRYVLERMREGGYNVGGEQSGHVILSDYSTTGDGLVTAMQVLAVVKRRDQPVSEVCRRFEPLPQVLKNVRAPRPRLEADAVISAIAKRAPPAWRTRPAGDSPVRHRARHSRDGRVRQPRVDRRDRRRRLRRAQGARRTGLTKGRPARKSKQEAGMARAAKRARDLFVVASINLYFP